MRRTEPVGRMAALRGAGAWLPKPRTVRMRLTLLCGGVILCSGGALLLLTFLLGGNRDVGEVFIARGAGTGRVIVHVGQNSGVALPPTGAIRSVLPAGAAGGPGASGSSSGGGLSVVTQVAAKLGSTSAVHNLLVWSLVGLGIVTVLGLLLGWALSGRMLRPLRTMRETTQQISEENLHERLALAGPEGDELRELGDTIDDLLGRLESAFEAQRRFVQNASHELRTPITMMRTSLDVATGKPAGVTPEVATLATKLNEGLDQAERLLEGFLTLARAQSSSAGDVGTVSLVDTITDALGIRSAEIVALNLTVDQSLGEAHAVGSTTLLPQVAGNLIENAVRHNVHGGRLRVATAADGAVVRLVVENDGEHLDPDRLEELGQPFHRLVDRTASDRGAGLGLSIVAAIVDAAGGTVRLTARPAGGLKAEVTLPAARQVAGTMER